MKYWLQEVTDAGNVFYTYQLLKKLIRDGGHDLVERPGDADVLLVSMVSVHDLARLRKLRREWPTARIIAGGAVSFQVGPILIWADAVCVGQGFELFKLKSWDEILAAPFVATRGGGRVYPSDVVDWEAVPMVQTAAHSWYYWAGIGCKNKCAFCLTSWTNREQENSPERVRKAFLTLKRHDPAANLILVANETQKFDIQNKVRDYMVKDYVKPIQTSPGLVRLGIEFATDETRRRFGKPITDADIVTAFELARRRRNDLHCFYIAGVNTRAEWIEHFSTVLLPTFEKQPKIMVKLTNIVIQPHTRLAMKWRGIDFQNMLTEDDRETFRVSFPENNRKRFAFAIMAPRRALAESCLNWIDSEDEYDKTMEFLKEPNGPVGPMVDWMLSVGMFEKAWPERVRLWWRELRDMAPRAAVGVESIGPSV